MRTGYIANMVIKNARIEIRALTNQNKFAY